MIIFRKKVTGNICPLANLNQEKAILRHFRGSYLLFFFLILIVSGCASLGARTMRGERVLLNTALQQTNDEQLLLNLVRLRYRDTPAFLQVSSISSQIAFEAGIDGGIELESQ